MSTKRGPCSPRPEALCKNTSFSKHSPCSPHPEALCKNTSFSKHSQMLKDKLEAESINTSSVVTALEVSVECMR